MPLAQSILEDTELTKLVDEFFFELHFKCEIMFLCGWGSPTKVYGDLKLDRISAMNFFKKFRDKGIRSHFWP